VSRYIVAIDQGTSSSRTVIVDAKGQVVASAQQPFAQIYPQPGWVEHDPEAIWQSVIDVTARSLDEGNVTAADVAGIGITNQRETTVVWDRRSGKCVYNAIVWQDRRTADYCRGLRDQGHEAMLAERTGLRLDPYFSASKIAWILDNVAGARRAAEQGDLAFGTIDTFLLWRMNGGAAHATDVTNASRTLLFDIHKQCWDEEILAIFDVPESMLPSVNDCTGEFGITDNVFPLAGVPVCGIAGDQQAALIGQAGFAPGATKSTYGTGCFVITNTGSEPKPSQNQLLTTIAYRLNGQTTYGLEGSIFVAGSAIQWLRDALQVIDTAGEVEQIAKATGVTEHVHVVPAFTGLGAPYWDPDARGAVLGLTRDSGRDEIVTATLQSVAFQTMDLTRAMAEDGVLPTVIRVDGGMAANDWFLQFLADVLDVPVERPINVESTVAGAAMLAGLASGTYASLHDIESVWSLDARFEPAMDAARRDRLYAGWQDAVSRVRGSG